MWFLDIILAAIPWWVWLIVAVVVLAAVHRLVGWKGIAAAGAVFVALFSFKRGQHIGETRTQKKARKNAKRATKRADKVKRDANVRNADPKRLREDDGFKRKS